MHFSTMSAEKIYNKP